MSNNIKNFPQLVQERLNDTPFEPDPDLVSFIENLLQMVKTGEIDHVIAIGHSSAHCTVVDGWCYPADSEQPFMMIGALRSLELDLLNLTIERRSFNER